MCTITFLGGVILLSLWMIGEYIGRIYEETKQRPQYIIEKTININKLRNMSNDFESNKNEKLKERRVVLNTTKD